MNIIRRDPQAHSRFVRTLTAIKRYFSSIKAVL